MGKDKKINKRFLIIGTCIVFIIACLFLLLNVKQTRSVTADIWADTEVWVIKKDTDGCNPTSDVKCLYEANSSDSATTKATHAYKNKQNLQSLFNQVYNDRNNHTMHAIKLPAGTFYFTKSGNGAVVNLYVEDEFEKHNPINNFLLVGEGMDKTYLKPYSKEYSGFTNISNSAASNYADADAAADQDGANAVEYCKNKSGSDACVPYYLDMFYYKAEANASSSGQADNWTGWQQWGNYYLSNIYFSNFTIDSGEMKELGYKETTSGKGFMISLCKNCHWDAVRVKNTGATGFGMDNVVDSSITNSEAINNGRRAKAVYDYWKNKDICSTNNSKNKAPCQLRFFEGNSGFGVGTGYSDNESMYIENCYAEGNAKYGYFFEHQDRFGRFYKAVESKGFVVVNSSAKNNMYNYGGERSNDVVIINNESTLGSSTKMEVMFKPQSRNSYSINTKIQDVSYAGNLIRNASIGTDSDAIVWALNAGITYANLNNIALYASYGVNAETIPAVDATGYYTTQLTRTDAIMMLWKFAGMPGDVLVSNNSTTKDSTARATYTTIAPNGRYTCYYYGIWNQDTKKICINTFNDVFSISDYQNALKWAKDNGIAAGVNNNNEFSPYSIITYKQLLTFIYRYLYHSSPGKDFDIIAWAKNNNLLTGYSSVADSDNVTWVACIRILYNIKESNFSSNSVSFPINYYVLKTGVTVPTNPTSYTTGGSVNINKNPSGTVAGYTFAGWIGSNRNSPSKDFSPTTKGGPKVYVAKWNRNSVTFNYDTNGGNYVSSNTNYRKSGSLIQKKDSSNNWSSNFHVANYGEIVNPYNCDSETYINLKKDGYKIDKTKAWVDGSGNIFDENKDYSVNAFCGTIASGSCSTVTLYANWQPNKINIQYNVNNGTLNTTPNYSSSYVDNNGFILKNGSDIIIDSYDYSANGKLGTNGLADYASANYINISRDGYYIPCDKNNNGTCKKDNNGNNKPLAWKDTATGNTFNQVDSYDISQLCDATNGDCTVSLYANWQPYKINVKYNVNDGTLQNTTNYSTSDVDDNGFILSNDSNIIGNYTYSDTGKIGTSGLADIDSTNYINIKRPGYYIPCDKENNGTCKKDTNNNDIPLSWNTKADGSGTKFNQVDRYNVSELYDAKKSCDSVSGVCEVELYANWELSKYKIYYNGNGATGQTYTDNTQCNSDNECGLARYKDGTVYENGVFKHSRDWKYGTSDNLVTNRFVKTNYTFAGWNTEADGSGDSYNDVQSVVNLSTENGTIVTLYAQWEEDIVTGNITYNCNLNGGSTSNTTVQYQVGANVDLTRTCTKSGWTFLGWNSNKNATEALESYTMPAAGGTLYAIYRKEPITLYATFNANGATLTGNLTPTCELPAVYNTGTQSANCTVDAPIITRNQYTVVGYSTLSNSTSNNSSYNTTTKKLTLSRNNDTSPGRTWYAITTPVRHKITFEAPGAVIDGYSYVYVEYNSNVLYKNATSSLTVTIPSTSMNGYEFTGWYSGNNKVIDASGNVINVSNIISSGKWVISDDITLTANWKKISEVTYNCTSNGGSTSNSSFQYIDGESVDLTKTCSKSGWTFVGWNTDRTATTKINSYTMPDSDVTLYGIYKKEAVTLYASFNANGATLTGDLAQTCVLPFVYNNDIQDVECSVDAPAISRTGYNVIGYDTNINSTANNSNYNSSTGKLVLNVNDDANPGRTWYALTAINRYKITFDAPEPTITGDRIVYLDPETNNLYNGVDSYTPATVPTAYIEGYSLKGWYSGLNLIVSADGTVLNDSIYVDNGVWNITSDIKLYSIWRKISNVTYDCTTNGGSTSSVTVEKAQGDDVDLTRECTKSGWTFLGWNTDATATEALESYILPIKEPNGDVTLYGIYRKEAETLYANFSENGATLTGDKTPTCELAAVYNTNTQATTCTVDAPTITREEHTAVGFNTSSDSTTNSSSYNVDSGKLTLNITDDASPGRTWYAITKPTRHKITFDAQDSTLSGDSIIYVEYNSDKLYKDENSSTYATIPIASMSDSEFAGWYLGNNLIISSAGNVVNTPNYVSNGKWLITQDIVLVPSWSGQYGVTYNCTANGGSTSNSVVHYVNGESVDLDRECSKSGWTFVGWNTDSTATAAFNNYTMQNSDITLYGIYKKEKVTLYANFSENGATLTGDKTPTCELAAVYNTNVQATTCTVDAPTITRVGYSIIGFNTSSDSTTNTSSYNVDSGKLTLNITDDASPGRTWYALTAIGKYRITFNAINGTIDGSNQLYVKYNSAELYQDSDITIDGTIPTASMDDYDFTGWYLANGTKIIDTDGSLINTDNYISNNKWIIVENITLYAGYEATGTEPSEEDSIEFIERTNYDFDGDMLYQITPGMQSDELFEKVVTNSALSIIDEEDHVLTESIKLRTGYKLRATFTTNVLEYKISVKGDVLGTGELSEANAKLIAKHVLDRKSISGEEYLLAADYNSDDLIKMNDVVKLLRDMKRQANS